MQNVEKLLDALQFLIEEKKILSCSFSLYGHDELTDILIEILKGVYQSVGIREIEKKILQANKLDIGTFQEGIEKIKKAHPKELKLIQSEEKTIEVNPSIILKNIDDFVSEINSDSNKFSHLDVLVRLEFTMDNNFERLLMGFDIKDKVFDQLKALVLHKFNSVSDDEVILLWGKIKASMKNDNNEGFYKPYEDIVPIDFFDSKNQFSVVRDKCATFIVKLKPLITKKMVEEGYNLFPTGIPGVARMLTLPKNSDLLPVKKLETLLFRSITQTIAIYTEITNCDHELLVDFALAMSSDPNGLIFTGDVFKEYKGKITQQHRTISEQDKYNLLILNLKRLLNYSLLCTTGQVLIEDALWQYKLGQEVIVPARDNEFKSNVALELYLQKDLCKFLIERNILSFGRSFGRSQIDLYHKDIKGEDFIIEAKVYKSQKKLTLNELQKNLVQLQSYMDQTTQPKGILAIYNFTNDVILAPKKWLRGRIFIICINMCLLSPSKRQKSLEIVESEAAIVDLLEVG